MSTTGEMEDKKSAKSRAAVQRHHKVTCPSCGKEEAVRTHRKTLADYLLSMVGTFPYRCHLCGSQFRRYHGHRWSFRIETFTRCPNCTFTGVNRVSKDRVPRSWANYWCRILSIPSYRCPECRTKFFAIRPAQNKSAAKS